MTAKEALHHLVDESPEEHTELALVSLEDPRNAYDARGRPLDKESLASLDRGLADVAGGRTKLLDDYKRERLAHLIHGGSRCKGHSHCHSGY